MNMMLWVLQALLAVAFLAHGWLFLSPPAELVDRMNESLPRWFQLFIGAAVGIMTVTASATVFHAARGEISSAAVTLVLFGIAAFVAYMRYRIVPIAAATRA